MSSLQKAINLLSKEQHFSSVKVKQEAIEESKIQTSITNYLNETSNKDPIIIDEDIKDTTNLVPPNPFQVLADIENDEEEKIEDMQIDVSPSNTREEESDMEEVATKDDEKMQDVEGAKPGDIQTYQDGKKNKKNNEKTEPKKKQCLVDNPDSSKTGNEGEPTRTTPLGRGNGTKGGKQQNNTGLGRGRGLLKDPSNYPTQPHQSDEEFATLLQSQEMEQFDDPISLDEYTKKKHVTWSTVPAKSKQKKSFQSSTTPTELGKDIHTENTGPLKGITLSNDYEERKETWSLQRQTSYGKLKENESFSCYMLLMLSKGKNEYKPFTAQKHLNHFRSLMAVLQSSDPTLSLLPLDELAEDQSEIHTIPTELKSIWNKLLYRHISSKHCTFGNRTTHQSFRIQIKTTKQIDPWQLGNFAHHTWGIPNDCHIMPDRIQEGVKVKLAFISNVADTTCNRDLSLDLEQHFNDMLVREKQLAFTERVSKNPKLLDAGNPDFTRPIKINVLPGVLEEVQDGELHQAQVSWIYCGRSWVKKIAKFISDMNDEVFSKDDDDTPTSKLRIANRNIMITVDGELSIAHKLDLIKYQNEYFTNLDYKHNLKLPSPLTKIVKNDGTELTLREYLLDLSNSDKQAGDYQLFTQIDKGNTIKTKGNSWTSRGITFTYHKSVKKEAESTILTLHTMFQRDIKPEYHAVLLPDFFSVSSELKKSFPNRDSTRQKRRMHRLKFSTHSRVLTTSSPLSTNNEKEPPLTIAQLRKKARGTLPSKSSALSTNTTSTYPTYSSITTSTLNPPSPQYISTTSLTSPASLSTLSNNSKSFSPVTPSTTQIVPSPSTQLSPFNFQTKLDDLSLQNERTSNALDKFNNDLQASIANLEKLESSFINSTNHLLKGQALNNLRLTQIEKGIEQLLKQQNTNETSFNSQENGGGQN